MKLIDAKINDILYLKHSNYESCYYLVLDKGPYKYYGNKIQDTLFCHYFFIGNTIPNKIILNRKYMIKILNKIGYKLIKPEELIKIVFNTKWSGISEDQ
jgi:hypothetical protein